MMNGDPVEFEVATADATTALPFVIRDQGTNTPRTLKENERLVIYNMRIFTISSVGRVYVFMDVEGTGSTEANENIWKTSPGIQEFASVIGKCGVPGIVPSLKTQSAGDTQMTGEGVIINT